MGRVESPALRGSWIGKLLAFLNPIVKALLASPLHWPLSRWFLLLSWKGAKTGQARSTPVSYVADRTGIVVTTADRWPRFAIGNPTFRVRYRGNWSQARAAELSDPEELKREHLRLFDEHGWFRWLTWTPKKEGRTDPAAVEKEIAAGRRLIRIMVES